MTDSYPDVAICILSFDGASDLWNPFFDAFAESWPDCPLPVYLVTNHKTYESVYNIVSLPIGQDVDWSTNLLAALDMISQTRVLFIFDDFMPRAIDTHAVMDHIKTAQAHDWPYLTLYPNNYRREVVAPGIRRIADAGVYRCTLVYGLFHKDALSSLLVPGENAWEFEIESGRRTDTMPLYSIDKPVFQHYHLLRKGMWMRQGYNQVVGRYDFEVDRPVESYLAMVRRETKEWLFRTYHRWVSPSLIEKLEKRRRNL